MSQYFIKVKSCATAPNVEPEYWSRQIVSPSQSNLFYNSGSIGIGVPNPLAKLHVDGNVGIGTQYSTISPPVDGCIISGSVGIGTTNPTEKLHIIGNTKIQGNLTVSGTQSVSGLDKLEITTTGADTALIVNQNGTGDIIDVKDSGASVLFVKNGGFVGIGTTNPTEKLHVIGNAIIEGNATIEGDLTVNGTQTIINTDTQITDQLIIENAGTGSALIVNQTGSEPIVEFKDDGATVFKIVNGGDVGIGTATPATKLHVVGNITASALDITGGSTTQPPIHINAGGYTTTPNDGAIERDSQVFYGSTANNLRGVIACESYYVLRTDRPLLNTVVAQDFFQTWVNLSAGTTYLFEANIIMTRAAGTTSHQIRSLFGGTATYSKVRYTVAATVLNAASACVMTSIEVTTPVAITPANAVAAETNIFKYNGILSVATSGTFYLQFNYSVAPGGAPTVQSESWISIKPIGAETFIRNEGGWT